MCSCSVVLGTFLCYLVHFRTLIGPICADNNPIKKDVYGHICVFF